MSARDLQGKVVLITGGSRGIGREIVLGAAERGARVSFCARNIGTEARSVLAEAEQRGHVGRVIAVRADISDESDVKVLFDTTLNTFGGVDVAINNAGTSHENLLVSLSAQDWDKTLACNLTGAFLVARGAVREFLSRGQGGRIVSIGSLMQNGAPSNSSYAASKGGLVGLTQAIACQYGHEMIYANLVVAGYVATRLTQHLPKAAKRALVEACPQKRRASAEEIASVVLYLASDRARGINGEAVYVSGGLLEVPL